MWGDAQAKFQALQAAFDDFCLSPIVSPTPRKPFAISEIISDILRLVEVLFSALLHAPFPTFSKSNITCRLTEGLQLYSCCHA